MINLPPLPNMRKLFKPDPGHILLSCDLAGADAQVVAWEADDEDLKDAFRKGLSIHLKNGKDVWPDGRTDGKAEPWYTRIKSAVHGTNYGAHEKTIAAVLHSSVSDARDFQSKWFSLHPKISEWQERIRNSVYETRTVTNAFGFRIQYWDRVSDAMWREALAWGPQSTVALVTDKGLVNVYKNLFPTVKPLGQVHDEGVYQTHRRDFMGVLPELQHWLSVRIPYDDPLVIPVGLKASSKSWGDCTPVDWTEPKRWLENERAN